MLVDRYQALENLYQPKIEEFNEVTRTIEAQIKTIDESLAEARQNNTEKIDKKTTRIALGILSALAAVFLAVASIQMPPLMLLSIGLFCASAVSFISARNLSRVSYKIGLDDDEQKHYANLSAARDKLKLRINLAETRLMTAKRAIENVVRLGHENDPACLASQHAYFTNLTNKYDEWVAEAVALIPKKSDSEKN